MKEGKIQTSGSPLFLKNRFGLGYNLTVVIDNEYELGRYNDKLANVNNLLSFVQQTIPEAKIIRCFGKEVTIRLPKGYEQTFPDAFRDLEKHRSIYGIGAFGVENSSLEELFLLLAEDDTHTVPFNTKVDDHSTPGREIESFNSKGCHLVPLSWSQQIRVMYWKRYIIQQRDHLERSTPSLCRYWS
jgi:ATP-binding cassette, subfamily A (ABC1), member 3